MYLDEKHCVRCRAMVAPACVVKTALQAVSLITIGLRIILCIFINFLTTAETPVNHLFGHVYCNDGGFVIMTRELSSTSAVF